MIDEAFREAYRELEARMKVLADTDGDVFLPNPEPIGPVEYVFVWMEPSLGRWARSLDEARSKVEAGFRTSSPRSRTSSSTSAFGGTSGHSGSAITSRTCQGGDACRTCRRREDPTV